MNFTRAVIPTARAFFAYNRCMPAWIVSLPDRLDSFLAKKGATLSRGKAQAAIESGNVTVNDQIVTKASQRLQEGDKVELSEDTRYKIHDTKTVPENMHLPILYEDDACFVIDKPAGLAVHPGAGMAPDERTLLDGLAWLFQKRKLPYRDDSALVHRLDRETTGCLLVAKTPAAHQTLQKQFETRTVQKFYLAIVAGIPEKPSAVIDAPIGRSTVNRTKMAVLGSSAMREAQTTYRTLSTAENAALLLCELHTGRTHQVRIHLFTIGHPLLGDGTYHNELSDRIAQEKGIANLCLHAWRLTFRSSADDKEHTVVADPPEAFADALRVTGLTLSRSSSP